MSHSAADLLRKNRETILMLWEERVRNEIATAAGHEHPIVINSFPAIIDGLVETLEGITRKKVATAGTNFAQAHGAERAKATEFSLSQVILEYEILREVIFEVLEKQTRLEPQDRVIIRNSISTAMKEAATGYSEVLESLRQQFVLTLTHDLRGPLTAAKANAELILRHPERVDRIPIFASRVVENMYRMDRMIQDLLDASHVRLGEKLALDEIEAFEMVEYAKEVLAEASSMYGNRFHLNASRSVYGFWSREKIHRALYNLLTNAVKYGRANSPITLRIHTEHGKIALSVHNWGNPIPEEELQHIFEAHRRVKATSRKNGWGLGLAIVKGITEAHGGTVTVESLLEKGTTFTLNMPVDVRKYSEAA